MTFKEDSKGKIQIFPSRCALHGTLARTTTSLWLLFLCFCLFLCLCLSISLPSPVPSSSKGAQPLSSVRLCDPMDYSPAGSSVHGILQIRILEWVAIPFSKGFSWPRDQTWVSCIAGGLFTTWATREALYYDIMSKVSYSNYVWNQLKIMRHSQEKTNRQKKKKSTELAWQTI